MGQEVEHVRRGDRRRLLVDDLEERLQVMGDGAQRVRPGAAGHELQIGVDQRVTQRLPGVATRRRRSNEAGEVAHRGMVTVAGGSHADATRITRVLGVRQR
jgi:hypothetical protein